MQNSMQNSMQNTVYKWILSQGSFNTLLCFYTGITNLIRIHGPAILLFLYPSKQLVDRSNRSGGARNVIPGQFGILAGLVSSFLLICRTFCRTFFLFRHLIQTRLPKLGVLEGILSDSNHIPLFVIVNSYNQKSVFRRHLGSSCPLGINPTITSALNESPFFARLTYWSALNAR